MPIICYRPKTFDRVRTEIIYHANRIISEHKEMGYEMTLRGVYYKFVSGDLFPDDRVWKQDPKDGKWKRDPSGSKNAPPNYDWLGEVLNDARLAGEMDWDYLIDRTRNLDHTAFWSSPRSIVEACAEQFRRDPWVNQEHYVEIWVEKDAQEAVTERAAREMRVPFFSCRGYTSQSAMWQAAQRLKAKHEEGKGVVIIHIGDHDPSGIDMSRDIQERLVEFSDNADITVHRVALNLDQVKKYKLIPNPAKPADARYLKYKEIYGEECWELDAMDLPVVHTLLVNKVCYFLDQEEWDRVLAEEEDGLTALRKLAKKLDG